MMRIDSVPGDIDRDDYFKSLERERFDWAYDRRRVLPCVGDRTRLTVRRVPLGGCSS
jgi:hypothetical protein